MMISVTHILHLAVLVMLIVGFGPQHSFAAETQHNIDDLANKIESRYAHTIDLSADFTKPC